MKTLSIIFIIVTATFVNIYAQDPNSKTSEPEVYSIHELIIKPDIDLNEFETFVMEELAPIYNNMKGQKLILVKGDRGVRTNQYAIILTFESLEDRNRIYPPSGEFVGDFGDEIIWEKFGSMVDKGLGETHTDYIEVAH
jgi:hypothetical protein